MSDTRTVDRAGRVAAPVFRAQGWTWGESEIPPSAEEITAHVVEGIARLCEDHDILSTRSGRLRIQRDRDDVSGRESFHILLELGFVDEAEVVE